MMKTSIERLGLGWPSLEHFERIYLEGFSKLFNYREFHNESYNGTEAMQESEEIKSSYLYIVGIATIALLSLSLLIFYGITHWTRKARLVNRFFSGPRILPFIGNFDLVMGAPEDWQKNLSSAMSKYGRCYRVWFPYKPVIIVGDGKVAEKVMAGHDNIDKGDVYVAFHRVLGKGLITAEGTKWKKDRKLLNPGFGFQYFEGFLKIFNEQSKIMSEILEETFPKGTEKLNLLPYIARCTLDSVFQTVLGSKQEAQRNPQLEFAEKIYGLVHCTREKLLKPYLNWPIIWPLFGLGRLESRLINDLMNFSAKLIDEKFEEKERTGEVTGTHTRPFIAYLIDDNQTKEEISFQINTLCATGAETTSSALNYILYLLALNPHCQKRAQEEIDSILSDDPQRDLTLGDISSLKYMEMCIKEGLRIYPSVPAWFRKIDKDVHLDDGRIIPAGSQVTICPWDIHRNPEVFPNPELFDPERFTVENIRDKIGSSGWIAFSSGPRNCVGHRYGLLQMKTMLTHILKNFSVTTITRREDLKVIYGIVLEPVPEIQMTLIRRVEQ